MIQRDTIRYSLYALVAIILLTLTGIFETFAGRIVIEEQFSVSMVILIVMLAATGYMVASRVKQQQIKAKQKTIDNDETKNADSGGSPFSLSLNLGSLSVSLGEDGVKFGTRKTGSAGFGLHWNGSWREAGLPGLKELVPSILNGLAGSLVVGVGLALLALFNIEVGQFNLTIGEYAFHLDMRFVFQGLAEGLNESTLTFGQTVSLAEGQIGGLLILLVFSAFVGAVCGIFVYLPNRLRQVIFFGVVLVFVFGLTIQQIENIITLPDALVLLLTFVTTYIVGLNTTGSISKRAATGLAIGVGFGVILALIAGNGGLDDGGILRGTSTEEPAILGLAAAGGGTVLIFIGVIGLFGAAGTLVSGAPRIIHNSSSYFFGGLLVLGVLNWQGELNPLAALLSFLLLAVLFWFVPILGQRAEESFEHVPTLERRTVYVIFAVAALLILLVAPQFMGRYITNVFNLIALYAMMGLGLNVLVGQTGLLDIGYVASFAIGAYALGLLTTPNILTCGGVHPNDIPYAELGTVCTGTLSFWAAVPFSLAFSAFAGVMLGIPVLRLRGDYLAIVTLGFGEIINRIAKSTAFKPLLGGAQGISPIPSPTIDLTSVNSDWFVQFTNSTSIYYMFLFGVAITVFIVYRLANSRTGRAWRAVRADEDVAEAVGINLIRAKLLAFGISAAFAGLGGAIYCAMVQGIYPDSFTLIVSINVLCLIIIGGMGSIPGVLVGSMLLIGLPELLRELDIYRMLSFGVLLVVSMLVRPEGMLPPAPAKLSALFKPKEEVQHG